jgi:hypothetical protein
MNSLFLRAVLCSLQALVLVSGRMHGVSRREQRILGVPVFTIKFMM